MYKYEAEDLIERMEKPMEAAIGAFVNGVRANKEFDDYIDLTMNLLGGSYTDFNSITVSLFEYHIEEVVEEMISNLQAQQSVMSPEEYDKHLKTLEIYKDISSNTELRDGEILLFAVSAHETAHILWTSSKKRLEIIEYISNDLNKSGINKHVGERFAATFDNILEDGRIERLMGIRYPGTAGPLRTLNIEMYELDMKMSEKGLVDYDNLYQSYHTVLLFLSKLGLEPYGFDEMDQKIQDMGKTIKPLVQNVVLSNNIQETYDNKIKVYEEIKDLVLEMLEEESKDMDAFEELMDQIDEMLSNAPQNTEALDDSNDQSDGQSGDQSSGSPIHISIDQSSDSNSGQSSGQSNDEDLDEDQDQGEGEGKGTSLKDEDEDEDEDAKGEGESDKSEDEESDESEKSKESKDGSDSDDSKESDDTKSKDGKDKWSNEKSKSRGKNKDPKKDNRKEKIKKALDKQKAEDKYNTEVPRERQDITGQKELQKPRSNANEIAQGIVGDFALSDNNVFQEKERTFDLLPLPFELEAEVRKLKRVVDEFYSKPDFNLRNRDSGILDTRRLPAIKMHDYNVFKRIGHKTKIDRAIMIAWDGSGSMYGKKQYESAKACAIIEGAFSEYIPIKIINFADMYGVEHRLVKDFDEKAMGKENFSYTYGEYGEFGGGNNDGMSIKVATEELLRRQERDKILIVLSDGMPTAYSHRGPNEDVKQAVEEARAEGIEVISIFFGDEQFRSSSEELYKDMYRKNIINTPIEKITDELINLFKQILL